MFKNNRKRLNIDEASQYFFLSFLYLKNRIEGLSRSLGFQYKARLNYEYCSFSIFILKESFDLNYKKIIDIFLTLEVADEATFNSAKSDFINYYELKRQGTNVYDIKSLVYNLKSIFLKYYDYSFADFTKINLETFSSFFAVFRSPNNVLITMSSTGSIHDLKLYIEKFKNKFVYKLNYKISYEVVSNFPKRVIKYIGTGSNTSLKIAFDASRCGVKESMHYELLLELIKLGSFKARLIVPEYTCFSKFGFFEVSFLETQTDVDKTILDFKKYLSSNLENLNGQSFDILKMNLINKYLLFCLDKEKFMYLLGKSYILESSIKYFLTLEQRINAIEKDDFKSFINTIINKNYYELVVRG